jgi:dihydrofolate reductase
MLINLIVAATVDGGIGINGKLPWRLKHDMKYFQDVTIGLHQTGSQNACLMGRKTWDSIPEKFKPLKDRLNIVLSRSTNERPGALTCTSLDEAVQIATDHNCSVLWVIGGAEIYRLAYESADFLYVTRIYPQEEIECSTFLDISLYEFRMLSKEEFKAILPNQVPNRQKEGDFEYEFQIWERK